MSLRKGFDSNVLPELSPFKVDCEKFTTETRVSDNQKSYIVYNAIITPKNVSSSFEVTLFKRDFDRLRVLQYIKEDGYINATWVLKTTEDGYDRLVFSLDSEKT